MPHLDVEGTGLEKRLAQQEWAAHNPGVAVRVENMVLHDTRDHALVSGLSLTATTGDVLLVRSTDTLARQATLAAVTGRHRIESGVVTIADCVQPEERNRLRRRSAFTVNTVTLSTLSAWVESVLTDRHGAHVVAVDTADLLIAPGSGVGWMRQLSMRCVRCLHRCTLKGLSRLWEQQQTRTLLWSSPR